MGIIQTLHQTLDELVRERQALDADIEDITRVIARHNGGPVAPQRKRASGRRSKAAAPGEGRREVLALLERGGEWTPIKLAQERGTSSNAARTILRKLAAESPALVERDGKVYRIKR